MTDQTRETKHWRLVALAGTVWRLMVEWKDGILFHFFPRKAFATAEEALEWGEFWVYRERQRGMRKLIANELRFAGKR